MSKQFEIEVSVSRKIVVDVPDEIDDPEEFALAIVRDGAVTIEDSNGSRGDLYLEDILVDDEENYFIKSIKETKP